MQIVHRCAGRDDGLNRAGYMAALYRMFAQVQPCGRSVGVPWPQASWLLPPFDLWRLMVSGLMARALNGGGGTVKDLFKAVSQPLEANVFLLQPQP